MHIRILIFILILALTIVVHPLIGLLGSVWYLHTYEGYEIVLLGGVLDVYFGAHTLIPFYTLVGGILVIGATFFRGRGQGDGL